MRRSALVFGVLALILVAMGATLTALTVARALPQVGLGTVGIWLAVVILAVLLGLPFASTAAALVGASRRLLRS